MPYSGVPDELTSKMDDCVSKVMGKGHDKSSAVAICKTSLMGGKSLKQAIKDFDFDLLKSDTDNSYSPIAMCAAACRWCIDTCGDCIVACESCPDASDATHQACVEACRECLVRCSICLDAVTDQDSTAIDIVSACRACVTACEACAAACQSCAGCAHCGQECGQCVEACEKCQECCEHNAGTETNEDEASEVQEMPAMMGLTYIKSLRLSHTEQEYRDLLAVKSIGRDDIRGYLTLWGNPAITDIESEYFTKSTDFWDSVLAFPRPLTWNHGQDRNVFKSTDIVGQIASFGDDEIGRFYEATLDRSHKYRKAIDELIGKHIIGTSSDSAPQYVIRQKTGKATWLKQWPLFAGALTDVPCEPRMIGSVDYFKGLGINLDSIQGASGNAAALRARIDLENAMRAHDLLKLL